MEHPSGQSVSLEIQQGDIAQSAAQAVVVNLFEGVTSPGGGTGAVDHALGGILSDELRWTEKFKGKLGETLVLNTYGKIPARYVVVVGLGKPEAVKAFQLRRAAAAAIRACLSLKVQSVATLLHGAGIGGFDPGAAARLLAEGTLLGAYKFTRHKSQGNGNNEEGEADKPPTRLQAVTVVEHDAVKVAAAREGLQWGRVIAEQVNLARDWVFDSANHVTPAFLAEQARNIQGLECRVLDFEEIKRRGMGSFAHVAMGSDAPPYLIHLTYKPSGAPRKKVALVGKGITFDSGGLSLKPAQSMELMKDDMSGAAAVLATMGAIARLKDLDVQVEGIIPTCENMPSARAARPGDIVRSMNGKTIEINNTDAEGRLILCDALTYAQRETEPDEVIDLATLTGACVVALGKVASGVMGTDDGLIERIRAAGESAGEKFWPLPLYDEYKDFLKSDVADLINAGAKGEAGSSAAGMFLKEFIENNRPWAHLDIAGPAYTSKDQPEVPKGATGVGVRTLLYYLYGLQ